MRLGSDEGGKVCEAYGVWQEKQLYGNLFMGIVRSTFVISPDGVIQTGVAKRPRAWSQ